MVLLKWYSLTGRFFVKQIISWGEYRLDGTFQVRPETNDSLIFVPAPVVTFQGYAKFTRGGYFRGAMWDQFGPSFIHGRAVQEGRISPELAIWKIYNRRHRQYANVFIKQTCDLALSPEGVWRGTWVGPRIAERSPRTMSMTMSSWVEIEASLDLVTFLRTDFIP